MRSLHFKTCKRFIDVFKFLFDTVKLILFYLYNDYTSRNFIKENCILKDNNLSWLLNF